jgi:hypothetical protein
MRDAGSPVSRWRGMRLAGMSWAGRAVVLWAVLAGLFLMHGAAPPAGGCQGGVPVTAMTVTAVAVMPAAAPASAPGTGHPAAAGPMSAGCCGGMMCATRRPPDAPASAFVIPLAAATVIMPASARVPAFLAAAFRQRWRPPGRQGLPLPLFLGVSRT